MIIVFEIKTAALLAKISYQFGKTLISNDESSSKVIFNGRTIISFVQRTYFKNCNKNAAKSGLLFLKQLKSLVER